MVYLVVSGNMNNIIGYYNLSLVQYTLKYEYEIRPLITRLIDCEW